ncbi:MAG TPA: dTDP-4-dehydrorhamnose 3,5-epimerase family protein, partial [Blastocatellia bacterium]|nr:dTDP-4-dehydrorhamnose 3,5-epimerase family protein [Blastocatellia bacterium]
EVIYKVTNYYSPAHEKGFYWNDPVLEIDWPIRESEAIVSDKDKMLPRFTKLPPYFHFIQEVTQ